MAGSSLEIARGVSWARPVAELLFGFPHAAASAEDGAALLATSVLPAPMGIVPFAVVDEGSLACVVEGDHDGFDLGPGSVVRWFLDDVPESQQGRLLDVSIIDYLDSLESELEARERGRGLLLDGIMPHYATRFLREHLVVDEVQLGESGAEPAPESPQARSARLRAQVELDYERPRGTDIRPVRMACQNVVIALAAMAYDPEIDGLAVPAWQTCEVPHVGTHEGNRALLALTLCDAFATGGTMEVRFDRPQHPHPEGRIPASLVRYARTVGVDVFDDGDEGGLSPTQARDLFLACTPMPPRLGQRVFSAVELGLSSVERICFTLLSQSLSAVALDFLLATTDRAGSILQGGVLDVHGRSAAAELTSLETSLLLGLLVARLQSVDNAGSSVRLLEAQQHRVEWSVDAGTGMVAIDAPTSPAPDWVGGTRWPTSGRVIVAPRSRPPAHLELPPEIDGVPVLALVPNDQETDVPVLRAPTRLAELRVQARSTMAAFRSARV